MAQNAIHQRIKTAIRRLQVADKRLEKVHDTSAEGEGTWTEEEEHELAEAVQDLAIAKSDVCDAYDEASQDLTNCQNS